MNSIHHRPKSNFTQNKSKSKRCSELKAATSEERNLNNCIREEHTKNHTFTSEYPFVSRVQTSDLLGSGQGAMAALTNHTRRTDTHARTHAHTHTRTLTHRYAEALARVDAAAAEAARRRQLIAEGRLSELGGVCVTSAQTHTTSTAKDEAALLAPKKRTATLLRAWVCCCRCRNRCCWFCC